MLLFPLHPAQRRCRLRREPPDAAPTKEGNEPDYVHAPIAPAITV